MCSLLSVDERAWVTVPPLASGIGGSCAAVPESSSLQGFLACTRQFAMPKELFGVPVGIEDSRAFAKKKTQA